MTRNPLIVAIVSTVVVVATAVFALFLAPTALSGAPAFAPAVWILVLIEMATGATLTMASRLSWRSAPNIVLASTPVVFGGWTLFSLWLVLAAGQISTRFLLTAQLGALVLATIILGGLAIASGHVGANGSSQAEGAAIARPLRDLSRAVVVLLDRHPELPPAVVSRCRAAAEQVLSLGEQSLRTHSIAAGSARAALERLARLLQEPRTSPEDVDAGVQALERTWLELRLGSEAAQ